MFDFQFTLHRGLFVSTFVRLIVNDTALRGDLQLKTNHMENLQNFPNVRFHFLFYFTFLNRPLSPSPFASNEN